jgi:hypothetical protein
MALNAQGKRSISQLYEIYKTKSKAEGRETVPTLHKPDLYRWRNAGDWDEWCAQRGIEDSELDNAKFRAKRERALNQLTLLTDDAISQLGIMINDPNTPPTVKHKLIETVLTRVVLKPEEDEANNNRTFESLPGQSATEEDKMRWLSHLKA